MREVRQPDRHENLIVAFRNFLKALKKLISYLYERLQNFRETVILYNICPQPEPDQVNSQCHWQLH